MNALRIAFFIFLIQEMIWLVSVAGVPLKCTDDGTSCIYFTNSLIYGGSIADVLSDEVNSGSYQSTQIETDVTADLYTATSSALNILISIMYGMIGGIYFIAIFVFGGSAIGIAIGAVLQAIVYYFYIMMIIKTIKEIRGDI